MGNPAVDAHAAPRHEAASASRAKVLGPILAIALGITISIVIVALPFVPAQLTESGVYSARGRTAYAAVSTIIASIITATLLDQTRRLWLTQVDIRLHHVINGDGAEWKSLNSRWRSSLSISNFREKFANWHIEITLLVAGLITTSIVSSFTPTTNTRTVPYTVNIPDGDPYECAGPTGSGNTVPIYSWTTGSGEYYAYGSVGCPTRYAVTLMGSINTQSPSVYAYADAGVAVAPSAIGVNAAIYSTSLRGMGQPLSNLLAAYSSNAVSTTTCVPVMTSNPISCKPGGKTVALDSNTLAVFSEFSSCTANYTYAITVESGLMTSVFCPGSFVGQGQIVIGATSALTHWLGSALGMEVPHGPTDTFTVTCDVDATEVFSYRSVTLSLQPPGQQTNVSQTGYGRFLSADSNTTCEAFGSGLANDAIGSALYAIAAAGNWQDLSQNLYWDGLLESLAELTDVTASYRTDGALETSRSPPWAFGNSNNALEDVLGLTAALVVSRINSSTVAVDGEAVVLATRVGSGKAFGVAFALPPLVTVGVLAMLLMKRRTSESTRFSSDSLVDILRAGRELS